jgi:hypothetical protein
MSLVKFPEKSFSTPTPDFVNHQATTQESGQQF